VDDLVLVEVKAVKCFDDIHLAQCLNYLKATNLNVCLLINFGTPKIELNYYRLEAGRFGDFVSYGLKSFAHEGVT
ncbi:MAG TPA: GxxExxY protein, partial [Lacipirellulaceae bacterium]|nr:GxxExxY protein [Lacipirellulaceae bacterium]